MVTLAVFFKVAVTLAQILSSYSIGALFGFRVTAPKASQIGGNKGIGDN